MENELKLRSSAYFIILRLISYVLIFLSVVFIFFGLVDLRTDEQKKTDAYNEFVSSVAFQHSLEAIKLAKVKAQFGINSISEVTYLYAPGKLVLISYKNKLNMDMEMPYDVATKKMYNGNEWFMQRKRALGAKTKTFVGEELKLLLKEAN